MNFEDEITVCIQKYSPEVDKYAANAEVGYATPLRGKSVHARSKNIVFHLLPVPFDCLPTYFQEKSLEYASQGIHLVHLWQDYWETKQDIVRSRIAALLGACKHIHARQTCVKRIQKDTICVFLEKNHLQGFVNARYNYGLFCDEKLVAAASFSAGRKMMRQEIIGKSYELVRYSNLLNHRVIGGLGKLIACFVKDVDPDDIMTYADLDWASGAGYKALKFEQTGITPPQSFLINPQKMFRYYPHKLKQKMTEECNKQNRFENIDEFLKKKGYVTVYNAGNLKYLLLRKNFVH